MREDSWAGKNVENVPQRQDLPPCHKSEYLCLAKSRFVKPNT